MDALRGMDNVVWLALGDGPERTVLMERCARAGINMISPGVVTGAQREACLQETDVFVQPSVQIGHRSEGLPVGILEAMAAGVPCIASATGGLSSLAHETGLHLIKPGDIDGLRGALTRVLADGIERDLMAKKNQLFACQFIWTEWGQVHENQLRDSMQFSLSA